MDFEDDTFWTQRFRHAPGVVHREIGGEHLLIPVRGDLADLHSIFSLNPVAATIWDKLDGTRDMRAVRDELRAEYHVSEETLAMELSDVVQRLVEARLVEAVP